jgi:hypothetical protein
VRVSLLHLADQPDSRRNLFWTIAAQTAVLSQRQAKLLCLQPKLTNIIG